METDNCPRLDCFCDGSCTLDTQFPRVWRNCTVRPILNLVSALFGFPLVSLGYAFFVIASVSPGFFLSYGSLQATKFLAALAFTIYLTHKMTNHWVNEFARLHSTQPRADFLRSLTGSYPQRPLTSSCGRKTIPIASRLDYVFVRGKPIGKTMTMPDLRPGNLLSQGQMR